MEQDEVKNGIHEFWDGKITCAMQAEWRNLGYSMYESYPPVKTIFIHKAAESSDSIDGDVSDDGCSFWTKYLHRPSAVDALCTPGATETETPMPTAMAFYEKIMVTHDAPAIVRSALGRSSGSLNDIIHTAQWPIAGPNGPISYSIIDNRVYYYYLRSTRCIVRAVKARYRTEDWYLRLIAMRIPVTPYHPHDNPDPLLSLLTVTDDSGASVVHTTFQEAARALGIVTKENEGELALIEAVDYSTPEAMLSLFTQITLNGQPTLRVLCGLGIELQSLHATGDDGSGAVSDDAAENDDDDASAASDIEDGNVESGHDDNGVGTPNAHGASDGTEGTEVQNWQTDAANDPDLQRVRRLLLSRCRGTQPERVQQLLTNIRNSFQANDVNPRSYGIPLPMADHLSCEEYERARWLGDPTLLGFNETHQPKNEQCDIDKAIDEYLANDREALETFMTLYVDGRAGTGKTTTMQYILNKGRLAGRICLVAAPTNLAALLYSGGQSCHSLFELLVTRDRTEIVTSRIRPGGDKAKLFKAASIIIVDELPSVKRADFEALLQVLDQARRHRWPHLIRKVSLTTLGKSRHSRRSSTNSSKPHIPSLVNESTNKHTP